MIRGAATRRAGSHLAGVCILLTSIAIVGAGAIRPCEAAPADTSRVSIEAGLGMQLTNEIFFEEAFVDTTFLGRRRVDTPEQTVAMQLRAAIEGTRAGLRTRYRFAGESSLGDRLQRGTVDGAWFGAFTDRWRYALIPRAEYRHDLTFGRDLSEWRAGSSASVRFGAPEAATFAEAGVSGEWLRSSGAGAEFLLDHDAATAFVRVDHGGAMDDAWRIGYRIAARSFPDSSDRNHLEHGWEAEWKHTSIAGHSLELEFEGDRRLTTHLVDSSRDNFLEGTGAATLELRFGEAWSSIGRVEVEVMRYDREDSTLYFDNQRLRVQLGPRLQREARWTVFVGPRAEWLFSPRVSSDAYRDLAGVLEFEGIGLRSWWSVTPAIGTRVPLDAGDGVEGAPTTCRYVECAVMGDHSLPGHLRLRALANARIERHQDSLEDGRSLFFSLDLRRLF